MFSRARKWYRKPRKTFKGSGNDFRQRKADRKSMQADEDHILEFQVGDRVLLKVSPWKGVIRFRKRGSIGKAQSGLGSQKRKCGRSTQSCLQIEFRGRNSCVDKGEALT
ncbi:hypothetical protein OSB04_019216 [Centaurea solstitialis]|uniref:Reverse transcriptase domain-containing protein n=1 Tax=Centaurea solstitialis TaxID=347529 RepID=A0AA38SQF1_9ASTR|nr:hypothetical protein OSB04_019216 [Centaurea solstitialis]